LDIDESPLFRDLLNVFGVPRVVFRIEPFQPLPKFEQQFDWITAFSIGFDRNRETKSRWGRPEWEFLLQQLQDRLAPGGKIYMAVNPLADGQYLTAELVEFFSTHGAEIERERIFFPQGFRG
jgi:hypothetical protein